MKTIPKILEELKNSDDIESIAIYENKLACMIGSPLTFLASIANFIVLYLVFHKDFFEIIVNSICLILFTVLFEIFLRIPIGVKVSSICISFLYSIVALFIFYRFYEYIGPSVWTIFCIQLGFAIYRSKPDMTTIVGISTVLSVLHVLFNFEDYRFSLTIFYFICQTSLLLILFVIFLALHKMNINRISKLNNKINMIIQQNNDIAALYEEISATEEELRLQNKKIQDRDTELFDMAYFDYLTKLPNRVMFNEYLEELIEYSIKKNLTFYLISIDIDFFKKINDTMGHHIGDIFIKFVGDRLKKTISENDFLSRTGGDEFSLIISRDIERSALEKYLNNLRKNFYSPFRVNDTEFRLTASFGVAIFPIDGNNVSDIIKHSDMAMNLSKELGKNSVNFFNNKLKEKIDERTNIENEMLKGIESNEFYLMFQPQYNLKIGTIRSFEVLTRWNSPKLGLIPPLKFIPVAEETGLINPLGDWILRTACTKFNSLKKRYDLEILLSVNISSVQLRGVNFLKNVKKILKETNFDPKSLEFEITESICIESFEEVLNILSEIRNLGIRIALDDFGTGYSSLSYLKLLPIDTLKIDKFFIDEITVADSPKKVVKDIISLGHSLGFEIVAEGVEHLEQQDYLKEHSCNYIQGFFLNKPLREEEVENLFRIKK